MRMSQAFFQTLRESPGEARTPGYQLLLRAGMIRSLGAGSFAFLPLGLQARQRQVEAAERALAVLDGQEIRLPIVQSAEKVENGPVGGEVRAVRFRDRAQRPMLFASAHDGAVLAAAAGIIQSYRQLPVLLYEVWSPFLDEDRGLGGLLGAREAYVVDAYSLHAGTTALRRAYPQIQSALVELPGLMDAGAWLVTGSGEGGASKLVFPVDGGEERVARCPACGYIADQAVAGIEKKTPPTDDLRPMQDVETPGCKTIAELAAFLGIPESQTAKAVFLVADLGDEGNRFVFAVVRGDTALNETKLRAVLNAEALGPATEAEIRAAGAEPGYGSPVGLGDVLVVVDDLVANSPNLVAGANRPGYHTLNVNFGRDYDGITADITMAQEGSPCPSCGAALRIEEGVALAEMWEVGEALAAKLGATYLDAAGRESPVALARYRIYVDRVIAALAERHHDEHGLTWPPGAAPCQVYLMSLGKSVPEVGEAAQQLHDELSNAGFFVLYDDRDERAGVKFNDADLVGAPVRIVVGDRGLKTGNVEAKRRASQEVSAVPVREVLPFVTSLLSEDYVDGT